MVGLKPLDLRFQADKYGPYAPRLSHLLNRLDGSYLHSDKRIPDASAFDLIWFEELKRSKIAAYLTTPEAKPYRAALDATTELIDGFELPLGMELLGTVDWLVHHEGVAMDVASVRVGLERWPAGGAKARARSLNCSTSD